MYTVECIELHTFIFLAWHTTVFLPLNSRDIYNHALRKNTNDQTIRIK